MVQKTAIPCLAQNSITADFSIEKVLKVNFLKSLTTDAIEQLDPKTSFDIDIIPNFQSFQVLNETNTLTA